MAKKRNDKETAKLLIKMGVIGYFAAIFLTCHFFSLDSYDIENLVNNLLLHMLQHPFDIFPINWEWVGLVTFAYFLVAACVEVSYEKQKNTRPGEENGSARWNDDFGKFASKYAEPFGKNEIEQNTGWLEKKSGLPWKGSKFKSQSAGPERTKSIFVALKRLIFRKFKSFWDYLKNRWLDFKERFRKKTVVDGEDEVVEPNALQRKIYSKICALEEKLDVDLDRFKPKPCLDEVRRMKEAAAREEKQRMLDGAAAHLRRRKYSGKTAAKEKLSATLMPVNRNMILSQNVALSMDGRATRKNCNTLILGGSGAGKTRFYLKPNLMQLNCSYVITDPSGEILQTMGKFLENAGYEIKVINLTNMDQSHCYNPFNYVREDADILVMIDVLTKNLTPPDSHSSDPFWPKSQAALLQAIAFFLYKECRPSERNFTNVMKLLRAAVIKEGNDDYKSPLDIIFEDLEKKDPNHIAVMQYSIFKQAPAKTASTILTCAQVDLAPFNLETIANLTGVDTIHMETIGLKPTALFCITPTAKTTYNWIISLAYTQLFETLYYTAETKCKGLRLPVHVRFLLDEFANIGQIPDFEQKLSTMRKYEISCAIIIQNMAQLETMYKESWKTIVGNCDEFIYLGGHESSSTEYVSKMLGKQTIKSRNSSKTYGRQGSSNISLNATGRELMTPDEIAHMSDQDCLVMVKGVMPFFDKKYDLLKHPNYKYTGDADDDLIFNIAEEIQTPQNNVFGSKQNNERRKLEHQAKEDTRVHDRRSPVARANAKTLAISEESLKKAGVLNNEFDQDNSIYAEMEVEANAPVDEFQLPEELAAAADEEFERFLGADIGERVFAVMPVEPSEEMVPEGLVGDGDGNLIADAVLNGVRDGKFINHLKVLNDIDFVVLDTETTGLEQDDEIVELGVVDKHGNMLYSSLFRNHKPLNPYAAEKNHLSTEDLADAPLFAEEWEKIKSVLNGKRIVAFNTEFDHRLFKQTLIRYDLNPDEVDIFFDGYLDAMKIYLDIKPNGRKRISLQDCLDALGMRVKETHRAIEDCRLTLDMLRSIDRVRDNAAPLEYLESINRN